MEDLEDVVARQNELLAEQNRLNDAMVASLKEQQELLVELLAQLKGDDTRP
jgi:hypothetical protein